MLCVGRRGAIFSQLVPRSTRSLFCVSRSTFTTTCLLSRRALSTVAESQDNLFEFTSGRWVYNDALRHKERKLIFNVDGLGRLAAESIGQSLSDVVSLTKLGEGGFNRTFVVALRDGRQVVARVPYPVTAPSYYGIASEVATIDYLRSRGIPAPKIYGYSPDADNAAGVPYILMESIQGSLLTEVWRSLSDEEVISVIHQLTQLEAQMMSLSFPAGGSIYFTKDLEKVAPGLGVPLDEPRFCVGPDTTLALWYRRRTGLDVFRGPYQSAEAALAAAAHKEITYLKRFGQPLLPIRREKRFAYKYQAQLPSYHIELLERYLSITPSLVPKDPALSRFCIRHPDLRPNNLFVSRSPDGGCKVISLFDWQHTSILPMFLLAGIPRDLQNHDDPVSHAMTLPSLPAGFDELEESERDHEAYLYRCRLVHYHYTISSQECNPLHHAAFTDPLFAPRARLFQKAGAPWEGESYDLKIALIGAAERWAKLTAGGEGVPCPLAFDPADLRVTAELDKDLREADRNFELIQAMYGVGEEGWVPSECYEDVVASFKGVKEQGLESAESAQEREDIMNHWWWDDMDEEGYF